MVACVPVVHNLASSAGSGLEIKGKKKFGRKKKNNNNNNRTLHSHVHIYTRRKFVYFHKNARHADYYYVEERERKKK